MYHGKIKMCVESEDSCIDSAPDVTHQMTVVMAANNERSEETIQMGGKMVTSRKLPHAPFNP